jgi:hypothetical protein
MNISSMSTITKPKIVTDSLHGTTTVFVAHKQ